MDAPNTAELRAELRAAADVSNVVERSLAVVGVLTKALEPYGVRPVLVGGMAVWLWASTDEFSTADIDLVMDESEACREAMTALGLMIASDGRHWFLPDSEILLEAPGRHLEPGASVVTVDLGRGREANVLSLVDTLIVRLSEFAFSGHGEVGRQVLALLAQLGEEERPRLEQRAASNDLDRVLSLLWPIADEVGRQQRPVPENHEFHELANAARAPR